LHSNRSRDDRDPAQFPIPPIIGPIVLPTGGKSAESDQSAKVDARKPEQPSESKSIFELIRASKLVDTTVVGSTADQSSAATPAQLHQSAFSAPERLLNKLSFLAAVSATVDSNNATTAALPAPKNGKSGARWRVKFLHTTQQTHPDLTTFTYQVISHADDMPVDYWVLGASHCNFLGMVKGNKAHQRADSYQQPVYQRAVQHMSPLQYRCSVPMFWRINCMAPSFTN